MLEPRMSDFQIFRMIQADRPSNRETLQTAAAVYAGQVVLAVSLLSDEGYRLRGRRSRHCGAVVSAILVIQPAMEQSISTSAVRNRC